MQHGGNASKSELVEGPDLEEPRPQEDSSGRHSPCIWNSGEKNLWTQTKNGTPSNIGCHLTQALLRSTRRAVLVAMAVWSHRTNKPL